jgi:hypothetical protein
MIGSVSSADTSLSDTFFEIEQKAKSIPVSQTKTTSSGGSTAKTSSSSSKSAATTLSDSEQTEIAKLKKIDSEVHAHEQAHMAAGGSLVKGGPTYSYTNGPDKKRYATAGEVSIDTSPVKDDPEATILKGERVKRAAMAPAQPSSQDYAVAAAATQMIIQAQMELARQKMQPAGGSGGSSTSQAVQAKYAYSGEAAGTAMGKSSDLLA